MKKKIALSLKDLKVKSFVTAMDPKAAQKVKGGIYTIEFHPCNTNEDGCIFHTEYPPFC
jgi:hypothetical protein